MPFPIRVGLKEDGARCVFRSVSSNGEGGRKVGKMKDRFGEKEAFQSVKGRLAGGRPDPGQGFLDEVDQGVSDIGVIGDEPLVEVGKAQEGAYILDFSWGKPACNAIEFDRVHS